MRGGGVLVVLVALSGSALAAEPVAERGDGWGQMGRRQPGAGQGRAVSNQEANAVRDLSQLVNHVAEVSRLAIENASTPELRQLATEMEQEYQALADELDRWSAHHGVDLGEAPARFATALEELRGLTGEAFDDAFLDLVSKEGANVSKDLDNVMDNVGGRGFRQDMNRAKTSLDRFADQIDAQLGVPDAGGQDQGGPDEGGLDEGGEVRGGGGLGGEPGADG